MVPGLRGLLPQCVQRGLHGSVDLCVNELSLCFFIGLFAEDALFVFILQKGKSGACLVWHLPCPTSSMLDHANVAICLPTLHLGYHVMMMFGEGQVMHLLGLTFHQELLISARITQHMAVGGDVCFCRCLSLCRRVTNERREPNWANMSCQSNFSVPLPRVYKPVELYVTCPSLKTSQTELRSGDCEGSSLYLKSFSYTSNHSLKL